MLPTVTHSRYVANTQGTTPPTVTSPADNTSVTSSPVTVTGTIAGERRLRLLDEHGHQRRDDRGLHDCGDGSSRSTSRLRRHQRPERRRRQRRDRPRAADGPPRRPARNPAPRRRRPLTGDDAGPGNTRIRPSPLGAFDIQRFQVFDSGDTVTFRLRTRDLSETFGSPLGAQLVDVYIRVPGAAATSTAAAHSLRNFAIAPAFAWSRLIQVQGFGQRYVDAGGTALGTVTISANPISRFITFSVPKATLGDARPRMGRRRPHRPGTASAPTRPAASRGRRRTSSSASARPRAPIPTARSTSASFRRQST